MTPDLAARLDAYRALLMQWNPRINLIAPSDIANLETRHIGDSLQLLPLLPASGPCGDLGSGAGFPGLMLSAADPGREWHLVESDRRKAAFLIEACRSLALPNTTIHATRIEQVSLPLLAGLTARALAPLAKLLPLAARLLARDGVALFPKGRSAEGELTECRATWTLRVERHTSATDPSATIFRISEIARAAGTP